MPFVVTRRTAERRAARRRPRGLAEIQAAQTQYQRDVQAAQGRLTEQQQRATQEFSQLSQQYENQLQSYQSALTDYNQRAEDFARRVDQYIDTTRKIESATRENKRRAYLFYSGGAEWQNAPWLKYEEKQVPSPYLPQGADASMFAGTWLDRLGLLEPRTVREVVGFETVPVPATPKDPGSFTEKFTQEVPQAPQAPQFTQDIRQFERESEQAKVRMEREIGERRAATRRARMRMTDRPLLSGA